MKSVSILGCGWLGKPMAVSLLSEGFSVKGSTTSEIKIQELEALEIEAYLIDIKKESTKAKNGDYQRRLPLFIGQKDGSELYIMPVRGKGLWDAIWGFVAVDETMTVQGVYFDHKGETPGLGAEIKQRYFMDDFIGEKLLEGSTYKGIKVAKGNNDPKNLIKDDYEVDALAGATITGDGVSAMIKSELRNYVSYFKNLKTN